MLGAEVGQGAGEKISIAAFVVGAVNTPHQGGFGGGQGRFQGYAGGGVNDAPLATERGHEFRLGSGMLEFPAVAEDMQDTPLQAVVFNAGFLTQLVQATAAVEGDAHGPFGIEAGPGRGTVAHKAHKPRPQGRVQAGPEQEGRIGAAQPLQGFARCRWIGPGFGVVGGNLAAVGAAGFQPRPRLAVDNGNRVSGPG